MRVHVNDQATEVPSNSTLSSLLDILGLSPQGLAAEVGGEVVSSDRFSQTRLQEDERIYLVRMVGGG